MWWKLNLVLVVQHVPGALVSRCMLHAGFVCVTLCGCDSLWGTGEKEIGEEKDFPGKGDYVRKR